MRTPLPLLRRAAATLLTLGALSLPALAQYQLVWADEFDGNSLDLSRWEPMIGTGCPNLCGWGNNELQYYRAENATVAGGYLTITAREESFNGSNYTSARLRTAGMGDWTYGRFEMRAKLPTAQGMWPAFWMLPTDWVFGGWAASGEIDVMELVGQAPDRVVGSIHYGGEFPNNTSSNGAYTLPNGVFSDDFHTFALEWDETEMRWYMDGIHYSTKTNWWSSGGSYPAPFNQRFHLLLNLAVGGNWPGPPNASTSFPQHLVVDYVRVYQLSEHTLEDCECVYDDMEHADPLGSGYFAFPEPGVVGGIGANTFDLPPTQGGAASLAATFNPGGTPGYLGGFARTHPLDLTGATHFELWLNPDPGQEYTLSINLQEDDNGDGVIPNPPTGADDEFQYELQVGPAGSEVVSGGGWQRVRIPLADFVDDNTYLFGGNGVFDPAPPAVGGNGELINFVVALFSTNGSPVSFRTDHWAFTRQASAIEGLVWNDTNQNGDPAGELGWAGVTVELLDAATGQLAGSVTTGGSGAFSFPDLALGEYEVHIDVSTLPPGVQATFDPDGLGTLHSAAISVACDEVRPDVNFGYAPDSLGMTFCTPAQLNSTGQSAHIVATGSVVVMDNDVVLTGEDLPAGQFGYFLTSLTPGLVMGPGGSQGNLCLGGAIGRYTGPGQVQSTGAGNSLSLGIDLILTPSPSGFVAVAAGEARIFQLWYRDANPGPTSNFTDAVRVVFQ